jgi:hypothetical protein
MVMTCMSKVSTAIGRQLGYLHRNRLDQAYTRGHVEIAVLSTLFRISDNEN